MPEEPSPQPKKQASRLKKMHGLSSESDESASADSEEESSSEDSDSESEREDKLSYLQKQVFVHTRNGFIAVQFAMHFVHVCYTKFNFDVPYIGLLCDWKTANYSLNVVRR